MAVDTQKLEELVLYLAAKSETDENFGLTKLNKLLFFCDFLAYRGWQAPITGDAYVKRDFGPCPRSLTSVLRALEQRGECMPQIRSHYGLEQKRYVALRPANVDCFAAREIKLVDEVLQVLADHDAAAVSKLSHTFVGWQVTDLGDEIPYDMVWLGAPRALTPQEIETCRRAAEA